MFNEYIIWLAESHDSTYMNTLSVTWQPVCIIWRPSSLSELTLMMFDMWLTHLGSEASIYSLFHIPKIFLIRISKIFLFKVYGGM